MAYYRYGRICRLLILLIEGIEFIDVYILSIIEFGNCPKLERISSCIFQENFREFPFLEWFEFDDVNTKMFGHIRMVLQ